MKKIIMDSGPLIALFDGGDAYHSSALSFIEKNQAALFTTLPVITEVVFLLDFSREAQADFLEWVIRGGVSVVPCDRHDLSRVKDLMGKYGDLPMDFADGSLVAACEKLETRLIATVDSDFDNYRYQDRHRFLNQFAVHAGE
jgi:hypothetical protein